VKSLFSTGIAAVHLRSYIVGVRLFGLLLLVAGSLCAQANRATLNEGFDKPLKKTVVDLGPSPFYRASQHVRNKLTCYYYSTFTVKEYDQGEKGAEWLSVVPSAQAACTLRHGPDERVYISPEWSGYFRGVKGTVAFFDAPDGEDGGLPFAAFDVRTGRKLFEDSSLLDYYQKKHHIKNAFRITSGADQIPRLTYLRVVRAGCDLKTEQADCWNKVRAEFGIKQTNIPICSRYQQAEGRSWESAVVYPVSVLLADSPQIKALDGPVFCWPTD
jgi:hypothetical protein